jgi:hypothetical protein
MAKYGRQWRNPVKTGIYEAPPEIATGKLPFVFLVERIKNTLIVGQLL